MKLALTLIGALLGSATAQAADQPNMVFIIADDCTHRDIGCYGGQAHTPHIDRLASEGMRMTHCFQAAPMCSPTRHNIYTGLYPVKSGAYPNHTFVKDGVKSVVHYLRPLGYRVALSGKRHIAPEEAFPFEYSGSKNPDMEAIDTLMAECVKTKTPFCQFVCSNEPHSPWNKGDPARYPADKVRLPDYYVDTPKTRESFSNYLAEITYFDGQVGQVLDLLGKHGIENNTLVMVVSEQGNSFPFAKWTCYDHGLQSAMVVRWPDRIKGGTVSDAMVEYVDVLSTFVDAGGGAVPDTLDGQSMLPVLFGETTEHKDYVYGIQTSRGIFGGPDHYGRRSVRSKTYKLIHNLDAKARFSNGIAKSPYFKEWIEKAESGDQRARELVDRYFTRPEFELYDVVMDPLEQYNIAKAPEHAETIKQLQEQLAAWMKQQGDEGQATEMAAIDRMLRGNRMVTEAHKKRAENKDKTRKRKRRKSNSTESSGISLSGPDAKPMNVLFIAIDDLNNYPSLMRNYPGIKTPNFDAFARTAMQFTRAYCPGTMCNPSRSAIMSGVAPYRSGIYSNGQKWQDSPLLSSVKPLPQAFRDSGYHAMGCGKLYHSPPTKQQWTAQWDDDEGGSGRFAPNLKPNPIPSSIKRPPLFNYGVVNESEISDFQLLSFARKRLTAKYDKPFFMAHGIRYPHNPWVVPKRFLDLYQEEDLTFPPPGWKENDLDDLPVIAREYAHKPVSREELHKAGHWKPTVRHYMASISAADEVFGEVIKALDSSQFKDNTIVVVWADHGFHMGEKEHFAKYALWEQTTNVLLMARVPGMTQAGVSCERPVTLQDLYPTLVDLCRLDAPGHLLDGRSLVPLLKNPETKWPHPAITTHLRNDFALRTSSHRYIRYHDGSEELYDSDGDPHEWTNLANDSAFGTVLNELRRQVPKTSAEQPESTSKRKTKRAPKKKTPVL